MFFFCSVLAFTILPLPVQFTVFDRVFDSWRIYILACCVPSVLGLVTMSLVPESPRHLMAIGKPTRALNLMKRMYSINMRKPADTFPVKVLRNLINTHAMYSLIATRKEATNALSVYTDEGALVFALSAQIRALIKESKSSDQKSKTNVDKIRDSLDSLNILLRPPYLYQFFVINFLQFGSLLGYVHVCSASRFDLPA